MLVAVAVLAAAGACTLPSAAGATTPAAPVVDNPANHEAVMKIVQMGADDPAIAARQGLAQGVTRDRIFTTLIRAGQSRRAFPLIRALGTVALAAGAFELGWKIGRTIDTKWLHLTGDIGTFTRTTEVRLSGIAWKHNSGTVWITSDAPGGGQTTTPLCTDCWLAEFRHDMDPSGNMPHTILWVPCVSTLCLDNGVSGNAAPFYLEAKRALEMMTKGHLATFNYSTQWGTSTGWMRWMSDAEMTAAFVFDRVENYSSQPFQRVTNIAIPPTPSYSSPEAAAARTTIHGDAPTEGFIGHQLDPTVPDPTWPHVPSCEGMTPTACQAALQSAGFGTSTVTTVSDADADLSKPAGAVISVTPAPGNQVAPSTVIQVRTNPSRLPIVWSGPIRGETYTAYVDRLRSLGWLGTATVVDLLFGDPNFGPLGVPCTSLVTGDRVPPDVGATLYRNPTSFAGGSTGVPSCGSSEPAPFDRYESICDFPDDAPITWHTAINGPNGEFYRQACDEAWAWARSGEGAFIADNSIHPAFAYEIAAALMSGDELWDARLVRMLTSLDDGAYPNKSDWEKAKTRVFFVPTTNLIFELHFYRTTREPSRSAPFEIKVKFVDYFLP